MWAALFVGGTLGWFIFQQTADGVAFPVVYNFGPTGVGNISIGVSVCVSRMISKYTDVSRCSTLFLGYSAA